MPPPRGRAGSPSPAGSGPGTGSGPSGKAEKHGRFSLREIATYSSTVFGLLCLIKVYGVAHFSTTTTATLITTAPERIILGTLAIYVYPTMTVLAYAIPWFSVVWRHRIHPEAWPLLIAVVAVTALMTPPEYHLVGLGVLMLSLLGELIVRHEVAARCCHHLKLPGAALVSARNHALNYVGGIVLLLGFLDTIGSPWMSAELFVLREPAVTTTQQPDDPEAKVHHVAVSSSTAPVIGYLLDESLTEYTVLNARTRYVMRLDKSGVVNRYACHEEDTQLRGHVPLLGWLQGKHYNSPNSDCDEIVGQVLRLPENAKAGDAAP